MFSSILVLHLVYLWNRRYGLNQGLHIAQMKHLPNLCLVYIIDSGQGQVWIVVA